MAFANMNNAWRTRPNVNVTVTNAPPRDFAPRFYGVEVSASSDTNSGLPLAFFLRSVMV